MRHGQTWRDMLKFGDLRHAFTKIMISNVFYNHILFSKLFTNYRGTNGRRDQSRDLSEADLVRTNDYLLTAFKLEGGS